MNCNLEGKGSLPISNPSAISGGTTHEGIAFDNEHNMAVCCAGCNGLKGESLPPATHPCWKSRKAFIRKCSRFIAECRLKNFLKYKTQVENVLRKREGQ